MRRVGMIPIISNLLFSFKLRALLRNLLHSEDTAKRTEHILSLTSANLPPDICACEERGLPGDPEFQKNGWWRIMLARYALALEYARGKKALDCCCGLGWGAYLLSSKAQSVIGLDLDMDSLKFAADALRDEHLHLICGDALHLPFVEESFDLVTSMESLEHFSREDGENLLLELRRVLKRCGLLIGSTFFARSEDEARQNLGRNPYHLHIWTLQDARITMGKIFRNVLIYPNRLFFKAVK